MALPMLALAPLAALAATYSKDAEAARFPWMSPQRIKALVDKYAYVKGDKSKGALTMLKPETFLTATTETPLDQRYIASEAGRFDPYKFANQSQFPYLRIDPAARRPEIYGHEGRHRISASSMDSRPRPIVLDHYEGRFPGLWPELEGMSSKGQSIDGLGQGKRFRFGEVTPITYENEEALSKYLFDIDVPLSQVGISLKPEGPGFPREDIEAYRRSIPLGKIPPPQPREFPHTKGMTPEQVEAALADWYKLPESIRDNNRLEIHLKYRAKELGLK